MAPDFAMDVPTAFIFDAIAVGVTTIQITLGALDITGDDAITFNGAEFQLFDRQRLAVFQALMTINVANATFFWPALTTQCMVELDRNRDHHRQCA